MKLIISKDIENKIIAHSAEDAPIESCGCLAGKITGEGQDTIVDVEEIYQMKNVDMKKEHFSFDTAEQFKVVKDARGKGLEIVAGYHSHPVSPARPSPEDIKLAYDPNIVYVIASLENNANIIKAFTIKQGEVKEVTVEYKDECSEGQLDSAEMKKVGIIQQKQKGLFAMRIRAVGGDLKTNQLRKIAEVSDKYADGEVHLSTRQGVEIHNVKQEDLMKAREELKSADIEMGACGPRIRVIVACPGSITCKWGIIETKTFAKELDEKYFRKDTPHKFKFSVTGCPHNCAKATENDVGIMGGILPKWEKDACTNCDLCVNICPANAIYKENDEYKLDVDKCIYCSICTASCPTYAWVVDKKGFTLFVGGTMGKKPRLATRLVDLLKDKEEIMKLIERSVQFYRKNGRKKERFGHCIDRIGEEKAVKEMLDGI